jgi:hypothetical protein
MKVHSNIFISSVSEVLKIQSLKLTRTEKNYIYKTPNNSISLSISKADFIFYYLLPFFESYPFLTRKGLDFKFWSIFTKLKKVGFHNTEEGRNFKIRIAKKYE